MEEEGERENGCSPPSKEVRGPAGSTAASSTPTGTSPLRTRPTATSSTSASSLTVCRRLQSAPRGERGGVNGQHRRSLLSLPLLPLRPPVFFSWCPSFDESSKPEPSRPSRPSPLSGRGRGSFCGGGVVQGQLFFWRGGELDQQDFDPPPPPLCSPPSPRTQTPPPFFHDRRARGGGVRVDAGRPVPARHHQDEGRLPPGADQTHLIHWGYISPQIIIIVHH